MQCESQTEQGNAETSTQTDFKPKKEVKEGPKPFLFEPDSELVHKLRITEEQLLQAKQELQKTKRQTDDEQTNLKVKIAELQLELK